MYYNRIRDKKRHMYYERACGNLQVKKKGPPSRSSRDYRREGLERSDSDYRRMKGPLNIEEGHSEWGMTKMKRPVRK